jgi:hypothetical protein
MKLGDTKDFYVLRKDDTDLYYCESASTTDDLLEAKRFDRDGIDKFRAAVNQAHISLYNKTPILDIVHIQIATKQL